MIKYFEKMVKMETERLVLNLPEKKNAADLVNNINCLAISKWLLVVPYPYTEIHALWFINYCRKKRRETPITDYTYFIQIKKTKEVIGCIGLAKIDFFDGTANIGYWISRMHQQHGYGSEALEAMIDLAFKKLKLRRINAAVFSGNPSSAKLLVKYGFKEEGFKKQAVRCKADGKIKDEYVYGLLKSEYKKCKSKR